MSGARTARATAAMSLDQTLSRTRGRRPSARVARVRRPGVRLLVAVVLVAGSLAGGWLAVRDSGLVRVDDVEVTGVTSTAAPRIRAALDAAGRRMTTLHVRQRALEQAVAGFPSVAALRVRTEFPHRLVVEVVERRPAAVVVAGGQRVAAAGSGLLLRDIEADAGLPQIELGSSLGGPRVRAPRALAALAVAAAAPQPLHARIARLGYGPRGLSAHMTGGPPLIFGSAEDAAAKWAAAARVLADPSSAGATYLDLRVTGRVAAGGLGDAAAEASDEVLAAPAATATAEALP